MNQDGYPDITFANDRSNSSFEITSYIYWGSGLGYDAEDRSELPVSSARDCAIADLDSDGDLDLIFTCHIDDDDSYVVDSYVYWNVDGVFSTAERSSLPTLGARSVTPVDLNDDGLLELVFSNFRNGSDYTIDSYLYWGTESGYSSSARTDLPTIGALKPPTVEDLNGDGALDIVMNNYYDGSSYNLDSYIYWGPDYSSNDRAELPTSGNNGSIAQDFDGDGNVDLAFSSYYDGDNNTSNYVYWGSARGYSTDSRTALASNRVRDMKAKDVDGDGYDDLVFGVFYDGDYTVNSKVYFGGPSGFDSDNPLSLRTDGVFSVAAEDIDLDGYVDLAFDAYREGSSDYTADGYIYWNSSRWIPNTNRSEIATSGARHISTADLNRDGLPEAIYSNFYDNDTYAVDSYIVWGADPWPGAENVTRLPTLGALESCVEDLNDDGYLDIVFSNYRNGGEFGVDSYIYWGSASGEYSESNRTGLPTDGAFDCLVSDLDEDGDQDLVFSSYYNGSKYVLDSYVYWNEDGSFSTAHRIGLPTIGAREASAMDLDGNGYKDLIFANYYDGSSYLFGLYIYWGDESGYSTSRRQELDAYGAIRSPLFDDLNKDGYTDLIVACHYDGNNDVSSYVYWGSASGYSDSDRTALEAYRTRQIAIADLNDDGWQDLVLATYYDGNNDTSSYIYWGSESGYSNVNRTSLPGNRSIYVVVDDLDLDGFEDIVLATYYDGDYTVNSYIYYGSAEGYSTDNRLSLPTYGTFFVDVADLDGNGYKDVLFANYREGSSDYKTDSYVYWNSSRGLSSHNYSNFSTEGSRHVNIVLGE